MATQIPYTSTLPPFLMRWLEETAKKQKVAKKSIIVQALMNFRDTCKKREMAKDFKRMAKDPEIIAMAEEGMDDYLNQLNRLGL